MTTLREHVNYSLGTSDFDGPRNEVAKATSYTVLPSDDGVRFTTKGAVGGVTFTLPPLKAAGYAFEFLNLANQTMTVTSAEGANIVAPNTLAANSISYGTGGDLIGGYVRVESSIDGTYWMVKVFSKNALTIST